MSNSTTIVGPSERTEKNESIYSAELRSAVNQIFSLFQLNYHNQFYKAFPTKADQTAAKRLWVESLKKFDPQIILRALKVVVENNEFLPTVASMIKACETSSQQGLPEPHAAYLEACNAASPKAAQTWSHPAVYHAGKATDWYFLQSNAENIAFPIFKQHYLALCEKIRLGEKLTLPSTTALPEKISTPVDRKKARQKMSDLRKNLEI